LTEKFEHGKQYACQENPAYKDFLYRLEQRYRLQAEGYDLDKLVERVGELVEMGPEEIMERGKERRKVEARSILCYWATDSLGISQGELAKRLKLTQPAGSWAVSAGSVKLFV
jgi:hypothetical protein